MTARPHVFRYVIILIALNGLTGRAADPALEPVKDVAGLPRVLLIGDSISIGYTLPTRARLQGKANVHRPAENCSSTGHGLSRLDAWLGTGKWDVIHFNFGLHDAKLPPEGVRHAPLDVYEKNLRTLVARMKATGARLVWATTTPVPKGGNLAPNRRFASVDAYNAAAKKVMDENGVAIDDLNAAIAPHVATLGRPNDVHFSAEGSALLAGHVAASIEAALAGPPPPAAAQRIYEERFPVTRYGRTPENWHDALNRRPSRAWVVDGRGFLRQTYKGETGLLVLDAAADLPADATLTAEFKKTEDSGVSFGIAARVADPDNYYLARFAGTDRLELLKVRGGVATPLDFVAPNASIPARPTGVISRERYREEQLWTLSLALNRDVLTAVVADHRGHEMARLAARDGEFSTGQSGLCCTRFAAASSFRIEATGDPRGLAPSARINAPPDYPVLAPLWETAKVDTPREKVAHAYDVVIAGAGTGGWAAAVQAARMGMRVLLLEETDWIGGQMASAAVTTMDESSGYGKFPVRERGLYREFHESMVTHYLTLEKDPFVAYFSYPDQLEGGYEPRAARAVLYAFLRAERDRRARLDLSLRSRVVAVSKEGNAVNGVTVEFADAAGTARKQVACRVLIDATEYGDVIPLTGARYRTGNGTSDKVDPNALVQDHTWTAVVREYPEGVPDHLKFQQPPPGHEAMKRRLGNYKTLGATLWGVAGKGIKGPREWRVYFAWRGMADAGSPLTGERSAQRHTRSGFNGGNDYPVTAATLEDPARRLRDEREGIYRTLGVLYYFQHDLGLNWSLAEDEGYATHYNRAKMHQLDLRPDLISLAVHLPQQPYVRESRRVMGVGTLVAADLTRFEKAKHFSTSLAMGDYGMDLDHGKTADALEADLDSGELPKESGPFQIPFEVFIPETVDGFVPAEKNISQSRRANGATRMQPSTMLTGQAAGAIAALAVKEGKPPRAVDPKRVQSALLDAGCTLIQRWHSDVPWRTPIWKATQILALHQVIDRPGPLTKDQRPLGIDHPWGASRPLASGELRSALARLAEIKQRSTTSPEPAVAASVSAEHLRQALTAVDPAWVVALNSARVADPDRVSAGEFAVMAAAILLGSE